ncbi:family 43 glycosylhydrolase [Microbacterium sp. A588]
MTLAELYRDPVYDGATDPTVVIADGRWSMFYTQRRATHPDPGPGVAWVHGSRIGVAHSEDGVDWTYAGTLEPTSDGLQLSASGPPASTDRTHWAPEVIYDGMCWRMYLTEIDGVPDRWPGYAREIVEYVSDDLARWTRRGPIVLSSDRVIDAAVARAPHGAWRLWYKDEAADSVTMVATSPDLEDWTVEGVAIGGRPHEGPYAFELDGWWWMIVDEWRGMAVYRSTDATAWERQGDADSVILGAGKMPGLGVGHHGAAVRDGERLWFYFFGHPEGAQERRCAVYRVQLDVVDDRLITSLAKRFNA